MREELFALFLRTLLCHEDCVTILSSIGNQSNCVFTYQQRPVFERRDAEPAAVSIYQMSQALETGDFGNIRYR